MENRCQPIALRCTKKLLDEFKRSRIPLSDMEVDLRYEWHVNLFYLDRKKCLMFTHTTTLYALVVCGVKKQDIINISDTFWNNLKMHFESEGFDINAYAKLEANTKKPIIIKKTNSRHVLGSMNDYLRFVEHICYDDLGRIEQSKIVASMQQLNRIPMGYIKGFSIDRMQELLEQV